MAIPGAGNLGKLIVSISTDTAELSNGLSKARQQLSSFDSYAQAHGQKISSNLAIPWTKYQIAATAAVAAVGVALVKATSDTLSYARSLNDMSARTGIAASELARLKFVAEQSDTSLEAITNSFRFVTRSMYEAATGVRELASIYKDLGINIKDSDGNLKDSREVFWEVIDALRNTQNETQRMAIAQKLLGRSYMEVAPLIRMTKDELERVKTTNIGVGAGFDDFVKRADEVNDRFNQLGTVMRTSFIKVLEPLLPLVEDFVNTLVNADWDMVGQGLAVVGNGIKTIAIWFGELNKYNPLATLAALSRFAGTIDGGGSFGDAMEAHKGLAPAASQAPGGQGIPTVDLGSIRVGVGGGGLAAQAAAQAAARDASIKAGEGIRPSPLVAPDDYWKQQEEAMQKAQQKQEEWAANFKVSAEEVGQAVIQVKSQFETGFGNALAQSIVAGKDFGESMKQVFKDLATTVIAEIGRMIAKWMAFMALKTAGRAFGLPFFEQGGVIGARNGLVYAADGLAVTPSFGERGIPAVLHPNEIVSPIDKFFDFVKGMQGNTFNITVPSGVSDPRQLAELIATEVDRRKRAP